MKGDFSKWGFDPKKNFDGVLHQQGRVLLDSDWNDQTRIAINWQDLAARDTIGSGVAAVPVHESGNFKVHSASVDGEGRVLLGISPGRIWADGLLVCLAGEEPDLTNEVERIATYLQPPIQDPVFDETSIGADVRDVVVLEVWREAINAFQIPNELIEPALGGPDTTERVHTAMAFRLFRLAAGETCQSIRDQLKDDFSQKGKLTVSLQPTDVIPGDCPVVEEGGYTGFEHHLYRIEIAEVESGTPMFKWSQFNGGLVGRGIFDATVGDEKISITANLQPIVTSGLTEFYLEAILYNEDLGSWKVTYGAKVILNSDHELDLTTTMFGVMPSSSESVFFRLWNDIREISDFPIGPDPVELRDGIRLALEPVIGANYKPADYWTFKVRAGEIKNSEILIDAEPPEGVHYHRVPLAELIWDDARSITFEEEQIEDCRDVFQPLTNQKGCCTFCVGDGVRSHGDFNSIEEALRHLPPQGGKICVLPGEHQANASIVNRRNIQISGCGKHSIVVPRPDHLTQPIFTIQGSTGIQIDHLTLFAPGNTAIYLNDPTDAVQPSQEITIGHNRIVACIYGIYIQCKNEVAGSNNIWIVHNKIGMLNKDGGKAGIFSIADDVLIERNRIVLVPAPEDQDPLEPGDPGDPGVFDPCADPNIIHTPNFYILVFLMGIFQYMRRVTETKRINYLSQSGIQIGDSSEQVRILENQIIGGSGHGITLGSELALPDDGNGDGINHSISFEEHYLAGKVQQGGAPVPNVSIAFEKAEDPILNTVTGPAGRFSIEPIDPGEYKVSIISTGYEITSVDSNIDSLGEFTDHYINVIEVEEEEILAFVYKIYIEGNEIFSMGNSGIGSFDFLNLENDLLKIIVEDLTINKNLIKNCARQVPLEFPDGRITEIGFGGIALSYGENIWIRENNISHDDLNNLDPISGVFINYGDKIEISGNRILNNGQIKKGLGRAPTLGIRCGIYIGMNTVSRFAEIFEDIRLPDFSQQDGMPALKVTNNIVTQFKGQALVCTVIGPTSVLGNQFTSQGMDFKVNSAPGIAGAVYILDLGISKNLINMLLSPRLFPEAKIPKNQLTRLLPYGFFLPPGNVMFNDNQTTLDLQSSDVESTLCSQFIYSLDDISYNANQSDCFLYIDLLLSNTILFGVTVRSCNNRYKEGLLFAYLSQLSYGLANTNTSNQATHCFLTRGNQVIEDHNLVLFNDFCEKF